MDPWARSNTAASRALMPKGTNAALLTYQLQFVNFCKIAGRCPLPASPDTVIGFMRGLLDAKLSRSTINKSAISAISALHRELDFESPTLNARVLAFKKGVTRATPPPKPKVPITAEILLALAAKVDVTSFLQVRDMTIFILMFTYFMRESEAMALLEDEAVTRDVDGKKVMSFLFASNEPTKTDQGRIGHWVIAEQADDMRLCGISWYLLYKELRGDHPSPFLFCPEGKSTSRMSDTLPNQRLKVRCAQAGLPAAEFSSHCLRHGGATAAADGGALERLLKLHGRWKSDCVRVYIKESLQNRLSVSRALFA